MLNDTLVPIGKKVKRKMNMQAKFVKTTANVMNIISFKMNIFRKMGQRECFYWRLIVAPTMLKAL